VRFKRFNVGMGGSAGLLENPLLLLVELFGSSYPHHSSTMVNQRR
jgi:hypothetical protein